MGAALNVRIRTRAAASWHRMTMDHIDRHFSVSLQVNHPTIDPDAITAALGLAPQRLHRVGEQKITPKGTLLKGRYLTNVWWLPLDLKGVADLIPFLEDLVSRLEASGDFLSRLAESGGRTELFCGIFTESNWDEIIPHQLSGRLAAMKIDVRLDAYPNKTETAGATRPPPATH